MNATPSITTQASLEPNVAQLSALLDRAQKRLAECEKEKLALLNDNHRLQKLLGKLGVERSTEYLRERNRQSEFEEKINAFIEKCREYKFEAIPLLKEQALPHAHDSLLPWLKKFLERALKALINERRYREMCFADNHSEKLSITNNYNTADTADATDAATTSAKVHKNRTRNDELSPYERQQIKLDRNYSQWTKITVEIDKKIAQISDLSTKTQELVEKGNIKFARLEKSRSKLLEMENDPKAKLRPEPKAQDENVSSTQHTTEPSEHGEHTHPQEHADNNTEEHKDVTPLPTNEIVETVVNQNIVLNIRDALQSSKQNFNNKDRTKSQETFYERLLKTALCKQPSVYAKYHTGSLVGFDSECYKIRLAHQSYIRENTDLIMCLMQKINSQSQYFRITRPDGTEFDLCFSVSEYPELGCFDCPIQEGEKEADYKSRLKNEFRQHTQETLDEEIAPPSEGECVIDGKTIRFPNPYRYGTSLLSHILWYKDNRILDPKTFGGEFRRIYAMRPMYSGSEEKLSEGYLLEIINARLTLNIPRNRLMTLLEKQGALTVKRNTLHELVIDTVRAYFWEIAEYIRKKIITENKVLQGDETPVRVRGWQMQSGKKKCQLWVMLAPAGQPYSGVCYLPWHGRQGEALKKLFDINNDDEANKFSSKVSCVLTDAYATYTSVFNWLNEHADMEITQATCAAHARRRFVYVLKAMNMWERFNSFMVDGAVDFETHAQAYQKQHGPIEDKVLAIMRVLALFSELFHIEDCCDFSNPEQVLEYRRRYSTPLLKELIARVHSMAKTLGHVTLAKEDSGRLVCRNYDGSPLADAIGFTFNHRETLATYLTNPDVRLDNNASERALRGASILSDERVIHSVDGAKAYGAMLTIGGTCDILGIDLLKYLQWVTDNVKLRMHEYRMAHGLTPLQCTQISHQPPYAKDENWDKNRMLGNRFHPDNRTQYDRVSKDGLDPWIYLRLLSRNDKQEQTLSS